MGVVMGAPGSRTEAPAPRAWSGPPGPAGPTTRAGTPPTPPAVRAWSGPPGPAGPTTHTGTPPTPRSYGIPSHAWSGPPGTSGPTSAQSKTEAQLLSNLLKGGSLWSKGPMSADAGVHVDTGLLGALLNTDTGISSAGSKLLSNAGSDLINLPGNTITGAADFLKAWFADRMNPFAGTGVGGSPSHVGTMLSQAWNQSMTKQLLSGNFDAALKAFEAHPIYSGSELTGEYGLLGRGLGAAARSGALGEDIAKAASTAAPERELIPGVKSTAIQQHYNPNIFTKGLQKAGIGLPNSARAVARANARDMVKQVDAVHQVQSTAAQRVMEGAAQELKAAKPPDSVTAAAVPHAMTGIAGGPEQFLQGLQALQDRYSAIEGAHHEAIAQGAAGLSPDALKALQTHQANLTAFLSHPDVQSAFESAASNAARQTAIEADMAHYGLHVPAEMETRALAPYALTRMEGVQSIPLKSIPTERSVLARQALKGVGVAKKELIQAQQDHIKLMNAHGDAEAQVLQAERAVAKAAQQEAKTRGFITGRFGQARLNGGEDAKPLPGEVASRLDRNVVTTDNANAVHQDLKSALKVARTERKQYSLDAVVAKQDAVKAANEEFQQVHKPYLHEKNSGRLQIEDPNAPLIRAGQFKGQRLRPLSNEEIKAHMEANNVPLASYIKATLGRPQGFFASKMRRSGSRGPAFTGQSVLSGTYTPGYGAIAKSQLSGLRQVLTAKMHDAFINRFGITAEDGKQFTDANAEQAARDFEDQYHEKVVPMYSRPKSLNKDQIAAIDKVQNPNAVDGLVARDTLAARQFDPTNPRGGNLVLVPDVQLQRYAQHIGAEPILRGKYLNLGSPSVLSGVNRGFRNTVLPFSTKLFVMHGGENATRLGLRAGLGAPVKLPAAFRLESKVTDRMHQLEDAGQLPKGSASQLEDLTAPGQHYGLQYNENLRHIEARNPEAAHVVTQYARNAADAYGRFAQGVFSVHRAIERAGQKTMLGMHMQRELQELAGSTLKAHTAISDYLDQMAHHYADPKVAEDAAHYVHAAGGQYNSFSPAMKYFISRVAPFAPWYLNAAKFVYHTLPVDHPAAAALLYSIARAEPGIQPSQVPHDTLFGDPVGTLLSDVKTGPSSYLDVGRFTPAGITDPKAWADMLFPAFNSTARAVYGLDPFWAPFKGPGGEGKDLGNRLGYGLNQLIESFGGPAATLGRILEGQGATQYNTSTLWHPENKAAKTVKYGGGILGGLARTFNPLQSVTLNNSGIGTNRAGVSGTIPKTAGSSSGVSGTIPKVSGK